MLKLSRKLFSGCISNSMAVRSMLREVIKKYKSDSGLKLRFSIVRRKKIEFIKSSWFGLF